VNRRRAPGLALAALLAVPVAGGAQRVQTSLLPELPASTRVAGLAGAGVANIGYAGTVFENPSGLAPIRTLSIEAALYRRPDGATYNMGAAAVRIGAFNLGGGYQYLLYPRDSETRDNVLSVGALTWRRGGLALGGGLKYLSVEDSSGVIDRTIVKDLGLTLALFDVAAVGLSWQNFGADALKGPEIPVPASVHLGFAFNLIDTYTSGRLLALVETTWTEDQSRRTLLGLEGGAVISGLGLIVRVGHGAQPPGSGYAKTAFGGGVLLGAARLDYAYRGSAHGGRPTHLFGLRWTR
jgi:hypothetical protein